MALNTFIKFLIFFFFYEKRIGFFFPLYAEEEQTNGKNQEHFLISIPSL